MEIWKYFYRYNANRLNNVFEESGFPTIFSLVFNSSLGTENLHPLLNPANYYSRTSIHQPISM